MTKLLLVDDDPSFNSMLTSFLQRSNYMVTSAMSSQGALSALKDEAFDLVLTDFRLPDMDGLGLIEKIKEEHPKLPVILITNYKDIRTAVRSIKLGAYEFVTKPVIPEELLLTVKKALHNRNSEQSPGQLPIKQSRDRQEQQEKYIVGHSKASLEVWQHIHVVAPTKMTVLILGESGTGKEYAANMIHKKSKRADQPFIAIDCGVLSKELAASELFGHVKGSFTGALKDKTGSFELADKGTIFLDEVGNLPYDVQIQLLRVIQERKIRRLGSEKDIAVDVRIIAATNESMKDALREESFRSDLYHRLNEFELKIPPLKERIEDLPEYITYFLKEASEELEKNVQEVSPQVMDILKHYHWPGNLRELRNVIKRAVLLCPGEIIGPEQLPGEIKAGTPEEAASYQEPERKTDDKTFHTDLKQLQETREKELILKVLQETKYNKSKAAKILNIDRKTLYHKIQKYNIDA